LAKFKYAGLFIYKKKIIANDVNLIVICKKYKLTFTDYKKFKNIKFKFINNVQIISIKFFNTKFLFNLFSKNFKIKNKTLLKNFNQNLLKKVYFFYIIKKIIFNYSTFKLNKLFFRNLILNSNKLLNLLNFMIFNKKKIIKNKLYRFYFFIL
jgi:hypothetical protein